MKKKLTKKLVLSKETLRNLEQPALLDAAGGGPPFNTVRLCATGPELCPQSNQYPC
jgi:hypothetical protein